MTDRQSEEMNRKGREDAQKFIEIQANNEKSTSGPQIDRAGFIATTIMMAIIGLAVVLAAIGLYEVFL